MTGDGPGMCGMYLESWQPPQGFIRTLTGVKKAWGVVHVGDRC